MVTHLPLNPSIGLQHMGLHRGVDVLVQGSIARDPMVQTEEKAIVHLASP